MPIQEIFYMSTNNGGIIMNMKKLMKCLLSTLSVTVFLGGVSTNVHATAGYAYSMGGLSTSVQQIIDTANNWALCGYTSYYIIRI